MTIQEKTNQLETCLSNMPEARNSISKEQIEIIQMVIEEATKIFGKGDILKSDPELFGEVYEKWNTMIDSKLSLFLEFNQSAKHHM